MATRGTRTPAADQDLAADAREAARRAGTSLSEWLDAVLERRADITPSPEYSASRARPALADDHRARTGPPARDQRLEAPHDDRFPGAQDRGATAESIERRLGRLVGSLGSNTPVRREDAPEAMRDIASRLAELREPVADAVADRRSTRDTVRQLEERLQAIARRMDASRMESGTGRPDLAVDRQGIGLRPGSGDADRSAPGPSFASARPSQAAFAADEGLTRARRSPAPMSGLKEAIAEVAARQRTLEGEFERAVGTYADRIDHRVDAMTERLEQRLDETFPRSAPRDLADEIRRASAPVESAAPTPTIGDLLAVVGELASRIEAIPGRLGDDFAERLEDTVRRLDTATRSEIDSIRAELREMAQDIDRNMRADLDAMRQEIARLADHVAGAPSLSIEVEAKIEDIAARLDTAARSEFGALRDEIRLLAEQLERSERDEFDALRGDLRELGERLSQEFAETVTRGLDDLDLVDIEAIRTEMRWLAGQLESARRDDFESLRQEMHLLGERMSDAPSTRIGELESRLVILTEQLAAAARDGDAETLAQLDRKISELAENVDASSRSMAGIGGLEKTVGDLFERIEESRLDALEAAREAAREAVERAAASLSSGGASDIHAVHETLKTIVDRLEDLEHEVDDAADHDRRDGARGTGAQDGAAVEPAEPLHGTDDDLPTEAAADSAAPDIDPDDLVGRIDAVAKTFSTADSAVSVEDDVPLLPGTRHPRPARDSAASYRSEPQLHAKPAGPEDTPAPSAILDAPAGDQSDFVAAARRAARAARAAAVERTDGRRSGERKPGSRLKVLRGEVEYRRALPIAAALVLFIFGAFQIATYVKTDPDIAAGGSGQTERMVADDAKAAGGRVAGAAGHVDTQTTGSTQGRGTASKPVRTVEKSGPDHGEATGSITQSAPAESASVPAGQTAPDADVATAPSEPSSGPADDAPIPANLLPDPLRAAAEADDPAAQFEIAVRYMDGRGLPQSDAMAADWYRKAASQGLAPAQYRLGSLYEKGQGVDRDISMARMWYQRAAEQGNRNAMHNLAVLYADGIDGAPDYEKAATWFRKAAEYGLADSQFNLAVLYARGLGVEADLAASYRWFAIAAIQGDSEALQKRDEVGRSLDEATLAKARAAAEAWQARPPEAGANSVPEPQGGWGDPAPKQQTLITREMIVAAQSLLNDLGYAAGPPDGQIGPRTRDAVRAFQRSVGLPDTGDISPDLIDQLGGAAG
ncbi:peptidoglycan-binding protein [Microbaculum marinum]|uniref:Peptidoglycan-binding protein n=1 Tax=Microbaculum marinum TaxID=1764581 RepID=A0AAW9RMD0_9HYPH